MPLPQYPGVLLCFLAAFSLLLASSCATIVSKSSYPFSVKASVRDAQVEVTDRSGAVIFSGPSPATMKLPAGDGYFKKAEYQVRVTAPGQEPQLRTVNFKLDGWYFGNLLFGGFIGLLIVDPLSGAMYKINEPGMFVDMGGGTGNLGANDEPALHIINLEDLPAELRQHLVELPVTP